MVKEQLRLAQGKWVVANCGNFPSEKSCKLVLMAPENQRDELLDSAMNHAIKCHGHKDSTELRKQLSQFLEVISV